ncbi:DUF6801 domain-containing protein [Longimycelium tulufanense]|uniref:DUF6801 domain-containing protein n=1 Tax=Longimycelium tulufanense TaxID=907463 RepID=UPI00166804D4|nr:DUF6801 domain-containing protein [Longimycelium tulufanense]
MAALVAAGSAAPSTPAQPRATDTVPATATMRGACEITPVGQHVIVAELSVALPASVPAGTPIRPQDASLRLVLPATLVDGLRDRAVGAIEGMAGIGLAAQDDADTVQTPVRATVPKTALPRAGELTLTLPGTATSPVPTTSPGTVTFRLNRLEVLLLPRAAETPEATEGAATGEPSGKPVVCEPETDQDTTLGTIRVAPPATSEPTPPSSPIRSSPSAAPSGVTGTDEGAPEATGPGSEAGTRQRQPRADACQEIPSDAYYFWSYYDIKGRVTVKKLRSGIDLGPGYLSAQLFYWTEGEISCGAIFGDLLLPPAPGSFTVLRFMPTTTTVIIKQVRRAEGRIWDGVIIARAVIDMFLSNVTVNGTLLDVGPNCRTVPAVVIDLRSNPVDWDVFLGGKIEAEFEIPQFSGCGVSEPLDPLFTGLISGPGNHIVLEFGPINFCPNPQEPCVPPLSVRR